MTTVDGQSRHTSLSQTCLRRRGKYGERGKAPRAAAACHRWYHPRGTAYTAAGRCRAPRLNRYADGDGTSTC